MPLQTRMNRRFVVKGCAARIGAIWLLACLLCGGMGAVSPARAQLRFVTEYLLDRDSVEVPFEYKDHQIFVTGTLDKRKNLTFLFDTGASAPVIDRALDVDGYKLADTTIQEAEGITSAESIWVSDLSLGAEGSQARVHNIAALVTDLSQISRVLGRKVDGIIGIPFCAGYVVEIDYEKHVLHFYNPRNYSIAQRVGDNQRSFVFDLTPMNLKRPTTTAHLRAAAHRIRLRFHTGYRFRRVFECGPRRRAGVGTYQGGDAPRIGRLVWRDAQFSQR